MSFPRVLCVVPMLPSDFNQDVLDSINRQTVPVEKVVVVDGVGVGSSLPERVSDALNCRLSRLNLKDYDFVLRVDADTVLPPNFLESNLCLGVDVVGYGHAHLFRVDCFLRLMGGLFHPVSDDSYLNFKFQSEGLSWSYWAHKPVMLRRAGESHNILYFLERGLVMWCNGYEPLHVLGSFRWEWKNIFCVFSYFTALLRRVPRLNVSPFVFRYQIHKLKKDLFRRRRF